MKVERNRQLVKDIAVYGIGNLGNKFLVFLLFPVLTFFLQSEELGYYDISLEAILFLLPIVTLQMRESTFRFLLDAKDETYRKHILTTTFFVEGAIFVFILAVASFLPFFITVRYFHLIVLSVCAYCLYDIYIQAVRAVYSSTQYVLINFISSFLTVTLVFLFYFVFKRGIEALFMGNLIARVAAILIIEIPRRRIVGNLSVRHFRKSFIREIFQYSIPMMWTAVAFGSITLSGKYIVNHYLGNEANGILAIAQKYMSILYVLVVTFHQAWQVSAVKNYKENGSEQFFSEVFNKYVLALCLLVVCISFGLRSFKAVLMGSSYYPSIDLIYIYCAGTVCYGMALFLEITFQCTKQTDKILYSIVTCAILSFPLTFLLTKHFGLSGMTVALTIAYAYMFIFRFFQTKSILPIRLKKEFYAATVVLIAGGIIFHATYNRILDLIVLTITTCCLAYFLFILKKHVK